jgi:hypothetical protein
VSDIDDARRVVEEARERADATMAALLEVADAAQAANDAYYCAVIDYEHAYEIEAAQ